MSQLEQHLQAWSLDAVEACLLAAGIELMQDAMELTQDDLEDIGLSTPQAIALRHSFGFRDEHAAAVAAAVALVAAGGMEVQSSAAVPAGQNLGGSGRAESREVTSQLEVHMHEYGLDDVMTLLHEGGLELLADVRALDWADLHAMGLSTKDASTLRNSLGIDATPPGKARPGAKEATLEAMLAEAETAATAMQKLVRGRSSRRNQVGRGSPSPTTPPRPAPPHPNDDAVADEEEVVVLHKETAASKLGLGLCVFSGDVLHPRVQVVKPGSLASASGRLQAMDIITAVNGTPITTDKQALDILSSAQGDVRFVVRRDGCRPEHFLLRKPSSLKKSRSAASSRQLGAEPPLANAAPAAALPATLPAAAPAEAIANNDAVGTSPPPTSPGSQIQAPGPFTRVTEPQPKQAEAKRMQTTPGGRPSELRPANEPSAAKEPENKGRPRAGSMMEEINAMIDEDRVNKSRPPRRSRHHSPHRGSGVGS